MPFHSLRHSFGTECARRGVPVMTLRDLMGHADASTTQRYVTVTSADKRNAIERAPGQRWSNRWATCCPNGPRIPRSSSRNCSRGERIRTSQPGRHLAKQNSDFARSQVVTRSTNPGSSRLVPLQDPDQGRRSGHSRLLRDRGRPRGVVRPASRATDPHPAVRPAAQEPRQGRRDGPRAARPDRRAPD